MKLDPAESKALATATGNLLVQFDIAPDPKFEALIALAMVASVTYGPRVYMINERTKKEKEEKKKSATVLPFGMVNG